MSFLGLSPNGTSISGIYPFSSSLVVAGRRKKNSSRKGELRAPLRPPSFFIKQSPVPARRPLRCVPTTLLSDSSNEAEPSSSTKQLVGEPLKRNSKKQQPESSVQVAATSKDKTDRVSKWASLFEAAKSSTPTTTTSSQAKDADAWFEKIFPKNAESDGKEGGNGKLSAQQEKSIQQLQTLVKTLGVATRNSSGPTTPPRSKASKLRPQLTPVQGGVDPVPFSSILKKLQSVSSSQQQEEVEVLSESEVHQDVDVEEEVEESDEVEEESSVNEGAESVDEEDKVEQLFGMTVVELRGIAKAKGLSGYSKLKKDELVKLLVPHWS